MEHKNSFKFGNESTLEEKPKKEESKIGWQRSSSTERHGSSKVIDFNHEILF